MPIRSDIDRTVSLLQQYATSINDENDQSTKDLASCGSNVIHFLRQSVDRLLKTTRHTPTSVIALPPETAALQTLLALAHDKINSIDFRNVSSRWLRLYADTAFLIGAWEMAMLPASETSDSVKSWYNTVRRLDTAAIIAGTSDRLRLDRLIDLIGEIQRRRLPRTPAKLEADCLPPAKRQKLPSNQVIPTLSPFARTQIPTLQRAPALAEYRNSCAAKPFIVRGFLKSVDVPCTPWPALESWRSADYLLDQVGEGRVVPVEIGKAYVEEDWGQKLVPFRTFLSAIGYDVEPLREESLEGISSPAPLLYLAQHTLFEQFPQLRKDLSLPDYVWSSPSAPDAATPYIALEEPVLNAWIGRSDSEVVSPAHTDPHFNCYAQVIGSKRVWIAPPSVSHFMCGYGDGKVTQGDEGGSVLAETYMTNTSRVPILRQIDDPTRLKSDFNDFFVGAFPHAQEAVLGPGDLLSLPPGWWHAMRGEGTGPGWSVSMWF